MAYSFDFDSWSIRGAAGEGTASMLLIAPLFHAHDDDTHLGNAPTLLAGVP